MPGIFGRRRGRADLPWPLPAWNTLHLRLYGAAELDALARRGHADDVPRTTPAGGDVFVGVDVVGDGRTSVSMAQARAWYERDDVRFPALVRDAARRAPFGTEERHGDSAVIVDEEQAAAFLVNRAHSARVIERLAMRGDTVVVPLAATQTIVTGGDDESGIALAVDRAEALIDSGADLVSIRPLVWRNGQWLPFDWHGELPGLASRIDAVVSRFDAQQEVARSRANDSVGRGR